MAEYQVAQDLARYNARRRELTVQGFESCGSITVANSTVVIATDADEDNAQVVHVSAGEYEIFIRYGEEMEIRIV